MKKFLGTLGVTRTTVEIPVWHFVTSAFVRRAVFKVMLCAHYFLRFFFIALKSAPVILPRGFAALAIFFCFFE